jgi:two-component system, sensor histidine kinase and response regulator
LFRSLAKLFLDGEPGRTRILMAAARRGDIEGVREAAHALAGSAATLGASALAEAARRIEGTARAGEPPSDDDLAALSASLDRAVAALTPLLTPRPVSGGAPATAADGGATQD